MLSLVFADQSVVSSSTALAGARTGDLILYASAPPPSPAQQHLVKRGSTSSKSKLRDTTRRRSTESNAGAADEDDDSNNVPTIGPAKAIEAARAGALSCTALLAMLMPAIAFSGGEREPLQPVDSVGIVVEKPNGGETSMLIYDSTKTLILLPLSKLVNRPACLRPLLFIGEASTPSINGTPTSVVRRQALHKFLHSAVDDLCRHRLSHETLENVVHSQTQLAAHLLFSAGIIDVSPREFCSPRNGAVDVEALFGAESLHLDQALTQEYAYGNQIWLA
jgi:hypothetical protein